MLTLAPGPERQLVELAHVTDPQTWMLVGGLMVHIHAHMARVPHSRPTNDVDVVLLPGRGYYPVTAAALASVGYAPQESLDSSAPFHRFVRGSDIVDVMVGEGRGVRFLGRRVVEVPGSRSATNHATWVELEQKVSINLPDLA